MLSWFIYSDCMPLLLKLHWQEEERTKKYEECCYLGAYSLIRTLILLLMQFRVLLRKERVSFIPVYFCFEWNGFLCVILVCWWCDGILKRNMRNLSLSLSLLLPHWIYTAVSNNQPGSQACSLFTSTNESKLSLCKQAASNQSTNFSHKTQCKFVKLNQFKLLA